jgi:predicted amidohydrolase
MTMKSIRCAIAQIKCVPSDLEGNTARMTAAVAAACRADTDLVCFPEAGDWGWVNPDAHTRADPIPGPFTERLGALAAKHQVWIGAGLCEKAGERLYDSAVVIDPAGRIVLKHRKINLLAWLMDPPYTPGDPASIEAVETPLGRIAVLICADSFQDELLARVARAEPDLVYIPYGWAEEREAWPEHGFELIKTVQKAARVIGAPVVGPNLVGEIKHGEWAGRTFEGLSTAADATGLSLVQGRWNREDLIILDL